MRQTDDLVHATSEWMRQFYAAFLEHGLAVGGRVESSPCDFLA